MCFQMFVYSLSEHAFRLDPELFLRVPVDALCFFFLCVGLGRLGASRFLRFDVTCTGPYHSSPSPRKREEIHGGKVC